VSLRIQLLGLGLLTLVLPWAGYRYVQELEGALRAGLEQALLASATAVAAALAEREIGSSPDPGRPRTPRNTIYGLPLASAPIIDGYAGDWNLDRVAGRALGESGRFWIGIHERYVYVFATAEDASPVYQRAPTELPYGDRWVIVSNAWPEFGLLFHASAPGIVRPQLTNAPEYAPSGRIESRALAYWREIAGGYGLEARLPLDLIGPRLGLAFIDVDPVSSDEGSGARYRVAVESSWSGSEEPDEFLYRPAALQGLAEQFEQPGKRLRVVDGDGWVLFDGGELDPVERWLEAPTSLPERVFRLILARGDPPYEELEEPRGYLGDAVLRARLGADPTIRWYTRGTDLSAVVVAMVPVRAGGSFGGAVILEQGSDAILTLTNEALVDLMSFTLTASLLVALGLLSYATLLSLRVRRLARAADNALSPEGEIEPALPGRRARDEIGDLARSFSALLKRLRDHTQYLSTLRAKLSHELRTPLAVVSTSLDNLEREAHDDRMAPYLARLRDGTERIDRILNAMSEATVLEQAIADTAPELFELDKVVRGCVRGYSEVYRERRFDYDSDAEGVRISGSADLVAQMLDKLVDNAVSFSAEGSTIRLGLRAAERELTLSVCNSGPRLPATMRSSLFDSLVSLRDPGGQRGHLGLGLYIVALIAAFHRGRVSAEDLPDGSGVVFTIVFPRPAER
jgi:dedicated sortase system histidine kinase